VPSWVSKCKRRVLILVKVSLKGCGMEVVIVEINNNILNNDIYIDIDIIM
jgi:hypothetical protein